MYTRYRGSLPILVWHRVHIIKPKSHKICISLYQSSIKFNCQPVNLFAAAVFLLPFADILSVCVWTVYDTIFAVVYHLVLYYIHIFFGPFFFPLFFRNIAISKRFNRDGVTSYIQHTYNLYKPPSYTRTRNVIKYTHGHPTIYHTKPTKK